MLVNKVTQFTAKTINSEKSIYFLSLTFCSMNKLKSHISFTCKSFMFWVLHRKNFFAKGNKGNGGGGRGGADASSAPPFSFHGLGCKYIHHKKCGNDCHNDKCNVRNFMNNVYKDICRKYERKTQRL